MSHIPVLQFYESLDIHLFKIFFYDYLFYVFVKKKLRDVMVSLSFVTKSLLYLSHMSLLL